MEGKIESLQLVVDTWATAINFTGECNFTRNDIQKIERKIQKMKELQAEFQAEYDRAQQIVKAVIKRSLKEA